MQDFRKLDIRIIKTKVTIRKQARIAASENRVNWFIEH